MADTIILGRADVAELLSRAVCRQAVEESFRRLGEGQAQKPAVLSYPTVGGGFHVKAGTFETGGRQLFVAKTNGNFPGNPGRHGLPTIQGVIAVFDAGNGEVLALLDSAEITVLRTAAATAVACERLAAADARVATIIGCGVQGRAHVRALLGVRAIEKFQFFDVSAQAAERARAEAVAAGAGGEVLSDVRAGVMASDIVVCCTPGGGYVLEAAWVQPGTFVAGVGADAEHKRELPPELLARSRVVVDVLEQCAAFGDLHHALDEGALTRADVHAELGGIVAGGTGGRTSKSEVFVFDSTGMALQDAAACAAVLERAQQEGRGLTIDLGAGERAGMRVLP